MTGYFDEADAGGLLRDYPIGPAFRDGPARMSRDAIRDLQERRFARLMRRAWDVPFYRRRWSALGIEPGDIAGLDDLPSLPPFGKADLMQSIADHPPFGDFHGIADWRDPGRHGVVLHTTSGTTGAPQPIFYGARDREAQNALLARAYLLQGMGAGDVVHSVYGFGMVNGGHYIRETVLHFTKALLLPAGTGLETRSEQQVRMMHHFGATVLVGFSDYMLTLARVAREAGLEPGRDIPVRMISGHLASGGRDAVSAAWDGAAAYDWYGVGDTGIIAAEGPDQDGLYVWEDAHLVEILDPDRLTPVAAGERGNICVTVLFKDTVYPIIRFNTNDVSTLLPPGGGLGFNLARLAGFQGRSDNMVKLRGINVYPTALAAVVGAIDGLNGEYVCVVRRADGREEMEVVAETTAGQAADPGLADRLAAALRASAGVGIAVRLAGPGETAPLTRIETRQKPIRLVDER